MFFMRDQPAARRRCRVAAEGPLGKLVELIVQRLNLAHDVAAIKYANGQPIDDSVREGEIFQALTSVLEVSGPYRQTGIQFLRDQIEANKVIQRGLHQRWHAHPEEVPSAYPRLAAKVRPQLDRITTQIMLQFESVAKMPRVSFGDVADLVDERLATEASARQLPRLHRAAALFAMRSLCAEAPRVPQAARCGPASLSPPFLVGPAEGQS
jgi:chorismate mutase